MDYLQLQKITTNLLNSIDATDRDIMSDSVNLNLIRLIKEKKYKSVMFLYNSPIEPSIDKTIIYCLNHNIDCYFIYNNKKDYIHTFKATTDNHDFEYYKNTIQPIPKKFVDVTSKSIPVDLIVSPLLAYDHKLNMIDYDLKINFIRVIHSHEDADKCGYAFSIQELHELIDSKTPHISFDYIVNEYDILKKKSK